MKKLLSIFISIVLVISVFTGCAKNKTIDTASNKPSNSSSQSKANNTDSTASSNETANNNTETNTNETQTSAEENTNIPSTADEGSKTNVSSSSSTQAAGSKNTSKPARKLQDNTKPAPDPSKTVKLEDALNKGILYLEKNAQEKDYRISDWDAVGLKISGKELGTNYIENRGAALGKEIDNYYMTDYARTILGVMAAGYDPRNFQGIDLVNAVKNSMNDEGKFKDTITGGEDLVNCHVWSMIALEAAGEAYDSEKALKYLEEKQNKDGGFYIFAPYPDSDADFTAMSVLALTMAGRDSKSPSVAKALSYLKGKLVEMERDPKLETAETLSVILEAIVSAGDDVNSYKINGRNVALELLTFSHEAGGFKHLKTSAVNEIASRQAITALGFYKNNKNMYRELKYEKGNFYAGQSTEPPVVKIHNAFYDVKAGTAEFEASAENLDEVSIEIIGGADSYTETIKPENGIVNISKTLPDSEYDIIIKGISNDEVVYIYVTGLERVSERITATVRIESFDKNVLYKNVSAGNAIVFDYEGTAYKQGKVSSYSFVMEALNSMGIKSNVSYSYGAPFITSINDIAGGKFGGWDGWMYFVNGIDPGVGMTDAVIKDGDEILVYYGDWGIKPLQITLPETSQAGQSIEVAVKAEDKAVEGAAVWVKGKKYTTDANGSVIITLDEAGSFEIYAEKLDENGKPLFVRSVKRIIVVK